MRTAFLTHARAILVTLLVCVLLLGVTSPADAGPLTFLGKWTGVTWVAKKTGQGAKVVATKTAAGVVKVAKLLH